MTAPTAEQPPEKTSRRSRNEPVDDGATPEPPKLRRRPMLIAVSVLLTAIGALLGAWLLTGLSGTESYIAVRDDIERGDQIQESDLVRTQLRTDSAVKPLLWDEQRTAVGQYAAVDMAAGSLVTRDSVKADNVPPSGQTTVGLSLVPGQTVSGELPTGSPVAVVIVPPNSDVGTQGQSYSGTIAREEMSSDGTTKLVDVIVPDQHSAAIAAAGSRQEVSVVLRSTADADTEPSPDGTGDPSGDGGDDSSEEGGDASSSPTPSASSGSGS